MKRSFILNPIKLFTHKKQQRAKNKDTNTKSFCNPLTFNDDFSIFNVDPFKDNYLCNAWVNIAVDILIRNIARADFVLEREGVELKSGSLFNLFRRPNEQLSRYDLWKETAAWWFIEGEAFWWFGAGYSGGLPKEFHILNPRKLQL